MTHSDRDGVRGRHVEQVKQVLTPEGGLGGGNGRFQGGEIANASITAGQFYLAAMDVEDLLYTDKEEFGHLLAEFVQGPAMPLRHGLVGSFGVDASNQDR